MCPHAGSVCADLFKTHTASLDVDELQERVGRAHALTWEQNCQVLGQEDAGVWPDESAFEHEAVTGDAVRESYAQGSNTFTGITLHQVVLVRYCHFFFVRASCAIPCLSCDDVRLQNLVPHSIGARYSRVVLSGPRGWCSAAVRPPLRWYGARSPAYSFCSACQAAVIQRDAATHTVAEHTPACRAHRTRPFTPGLFAHHACADALAGGSDAFAIGAAARPSAGTPCISSRSISSLGC